MAGMHKAVTLPSFEESFGQSPVRRLSISSLCTPAPNSTPSHPRHRLLDQRPLPNGVIPPRPRREIHAKTVSFLLQELLNFVHKPLPNDNEFIDAIAKTSYIKDYLEQSYWVKHNVARRPITFPAFRIVDAECVSYRIHLPVATVLDAAFERCVVEPQSRLRHGRSKEGLSRRNAIQEAALE
ncbi:hypothetical protein ISF_09697 [Cordyceps fumosorosea ARSEF 2679]|uniref:Uncharacterized protein n=1 Tax=Cordyceps fumosorosea (strain ARSEF 2679) TaxID=1081104 RepID=A0A167DRY7_CORFA|nr:hypothetical protein ISF_09697 [Cordyceps fumosorosea ARSEF 2679]OAA42781.1 hypothetical protein ISF_09697 [Cordyceps fumosorosea ARSEF 2679]